MLGLFVVISSILDYRIQGDHSGCSQPPVDIKTKVPFQYEAYLLKRNFCFDVNRRFDNLNCHPGLAFKSVLNGAQLITI